MKRWRLCLAALLVLTGSLASSPVVRGAVQGLLEAPAPTEVLEGRALDLFGEPLAGCLVYAAQVEGDPTLEPYVPSISWQNTRLSRKLGLGTRLEGSAWTKADGSFRIEGLKMGEHRLFWIPSGNHTDPVELTVRPVRTGAEPCTVTPQGAFLVVRWRDDERRPWPTGFQPVRGRNLGPNILSAWLHLRISTDDSDEWRASLRAKQAGLPWIAPFFVGLGEAWYQVEPGETYLAPDLWGTGGLEALYISPDNPLTVKELRAGLLVHRGDLETWLVDPDGNAYRTDNQVRVLSEDGELVARTDRYHGGPLVRWSLLPGRYEVIVSVEDSVPTCGSGWYPQAARHAPVSEWCEVRAGEQTRVDLHLRPGGRLKILAELPGGSDDPRITEWKAGHDSGKCSAANRLLELEDSGPGLLGSVEELGSGEVRELRFLIPDCFDNYDDPRLLPGLATRTDTVIPPGDHWLRLHSATYRSVAILVHVTDGELTTITVPLVAR